MYGLSAFEFVGEFGRKIQRVGGGVADKTMIGHGNPLWVG